MAAGDGSGSGNNMNFYGDEHLYTPPVNHWLSMAEVIARYGFNPKPYVDEKTPRLISKLLQLDGHLRRVYLEDGAGREGVSVKEHPLARPQLVAAPKE
jgi:hypothetical protein